MCSLFKHLVIPDVGDPVVLPTQTDIKTVFLVAEHSKALGLDLSVAPGLNRRRRTKGDYYVLVVGLGRGKGVSGLTLQTLL